MNKSTISQIKKHNGFIRNPTDSMKLTTRPSSSGSIWHQSIEESLNILKNNSDTDSDCSSNCSNSTLSDNEQLSKANKKNDSRQQNHQKRKSLKNNISSPPPTNDEFSKYSKSNNIMVVVRERPLNRKEIAIHCKNSLRILNNKVIIILSPGVPADDYLRNKRSREKKYAFDYVFNAGCNNQQIFERTTKLLIDGVINGYNATVFAYGATGAGKTYTMTGNTKDPGLMVLTLNELFHKCQSNQNRFTYHLSMSYLEVYNEYIRDLLSSSREHLELREDPIKGVTVAGITELHIHSAVQVLGELQMGNKKRQTESTHANLTSSRSHAILQIIVEQKSNVANIAEVVKIGKLSLIDLAGSERASLTMNRGARLIEGANINRSLLSLANCINALAKGQKKRFVPYRDSKLTRLLKDSLGGNCRTVMIANVSPADFSYEDSSNTLKYANRAKNIKTKVSKNEVSVKQHISKYMDIIKQLRQEIYALKDRIPNKVSTAASDMHSIHKTIHSINNHQPSMVSKEQERLLSKARTEMMDRFSALLQIKRQYLDVEKQLIKYIQTRNECQIEIEKIQSWTSSKSQSAVNTNSDEYKSKQKQLKLKLNDIQQIQIEIENKSRKKEELLPKVNEMMQIIEQFRTKQISKYFSKRGENSQLKYLQKLIELEFRIYKFQIDKIELEDNSILFRDVIHQKDIAIQRLEKQLQLRDDIIYQFQESQPQYKQIIPQSAFVDLNVLKEENQYGQKLLQQLSSSIISTPMSKTKRLMHRRSSWILPLPQEWNIKQQYKKQRNSSIIDENVAMLINSTEDLFINKQMNKKSKIHNKFYPTQFNSKRKSSQKMHYKQKNTIHGQKNNYSSIGHRSYPRPWAVENNNDNYRKSRLKNISNIKKNKMLNAIHRQSENRNPVKSRLKKNQRQRYQSQNYNKMNANGSKISSNYFNVQRILPTKPIKPKPRPKQFKNRFKTKHKSNDNLFAKHHQKQNIESKIEKVNRNQHRRTSVALQTLRKHREREKEKRLRSIYG